MHSSTGQVRDAQFTPMWRQRPGCRAALFLMISTKSSGGSVAPSSCGTAALLPKLSSWAAASLLSGYAWSLDTFVDYAWLDLTTLSIVIIVLLVVEVRCSRRANEPRPHLAACDRVFA